MPSVIPGFEYDIFISYRHNDNRSGWVTEFVTALQEELAATIKEPISVYFDTNPHDGLLETHNVDKSLEGKLKCLIFIPIISQTYCDLKSFAWQHEFCAFNKLAKEDKIERDIKLNNGNVTSRILPIKIHDLDADDKTLLEAEIGGVLRAIEFIYKETGVNRPLKSTDNKNDNQNKTDYRNQVNKVANAVKEIVTSIKNPSVPPRLATVNNSVPTEKPESKKKVAIVCGIILLLLVGAYFLYPGLVSPTQSLEEVDKSVAVLAFVDMSENKDQEWFSDGLTEEILNSLAKLNELKVTARTSSFYFKGKDVSLQEIASKLGVAHVVEGSVRKLDDKLRITAQLIRASDGFHIWSETYDRSTDDLFSVQADIAENVAKALLKELTPEKQEMLHSVKPHNMEAYEFYLRGTRIHLDQFLVTRLLVYFEESEKYLLKAISLAPDYAEAYGALANLYDTRAYYSTDLTQARFRVRRDSVIQIGYRLNPNSPEVLLACFETQRKSDSSFYFLKKAYKIAPSMAYVNHALSTFYGARIGLPELAIKHSEKATELDPLSPLYLKRLLYAQYDAEHFDDAIKTGKRIAELNMQDVNVYHCLFLISLIRNNREEALEYAKTIEEVSPDEGVARLTPFRLALQGNKPPGPIDDLIILSMLKMKTEFLKVLDKRTTPDKDGIINTEPIRLSRPYYDFVRNEPEFKIILERLQKSHDLKMMRYGDLN